MERITKNTSDHTKYQESFFFFLLALAEGVTSTNEKKKY